MEKILKFMIKLLLGPSRKLYRQAVGGKWYCHAGKVNAGMTWLEIWTRSSSRPYPFSEVEPIEIPLEGGSSFTSWGPYKGIIHQESW